MWLDALEQAVLCSATDALHRHIWMCNSIMDHVKQASSARQYHAVLKGALREPIHVPYTWATEQLAKKQGPFRSNFTQVLKVCRALPD